MAETPRCTRRLAAMDGVTPEHQCYLAAGHEGRHEHFATTEGVAGIRYTWPDNRSCADLPAPAAPSVGEPEPPAKQPQNPPRTTAQRIANYRRAIRELQRAYDLRDRVLLLDSHRINGLEAQCAALRSSLEEARKDTRRLEWLMMEDRRPWTRDEIDANLEDRA